jgi:uncharacterized protein (DUF302 family)
MVRLEAAVTAKGMTVFAHIDHAAGADKMRRSGPLTNISPRPYRRSCG